MKKVLVRFEVATNITGVGYVDIWCDQKENFSRRGKAAAEEYSITSGAHIRMIDLWDSLLEEQKAVYGYEFSKFLSEELHEVWIGYEIIDIERPEEEFYFDEEIEVGKRRFKPRKPIEGKCQEKSMFYYNNDKFDIHSEADTKEELAREVKEEFKIDLALYVDRDTKELFNSAKRLRASLLEAFEEVI